MTLEIAITHPVVVKGTVRGMRKEREIICLVDGIAVLEEIDRREALLACRIVNGNMVVDYRYWNGRFYRCVAPKDGVPSGIDLAVRTGIFGEIMSIVARRYPNRSSLDGTWPTEIVTKAWAWETDGKTLPVPERLDTLVAGGAVTQVSLEHADEMIEAVGSIVSSGFVCEGALFMPAPEPVYIASFDNSDIAARLGDRENLGPFHKNENIYPLSLPRLMSPEMKDHRERYKPRQGKFARGVSIFTPEVFGVGLAEDELVRVSRHVLDEVDRMLAKNGYTGNSWRKAAPASLRAAWEALRHHVPVDGKPVETDGLESNLSQLAVEIRAYKDVDRSSGVFWAMLLGNIERTIRHLDESTIRIDIPDARSPRVG